MSITKLAGLISALAVIAGAVLWPINHFQSKAEAADAKQEVERKQAKSVNELRAEFYLARIKELNAKAKPTKDEQDEKDRLLALVKAIEESEKVAK